MKSYTQMTMLRKTRKRHFQLLEVMIAAFLIVICAAPTLRIFTTIYLQQKQIIEVNTINQYVHRIHFEIVEKLYKHIIPFGQILDAQRMPVEGEVDEQLQRLGYKAFYTFTGYQKKKVSKHLVTLKIDLQHISPSLSDQNKKTIAYSYRVYIDTSNQENTQPLKSDDEPSTDVEQEEETEAVETHTNSLNTLNKLEK